MRDLSRSSILVVENNAHMRSVVVAILRAFGVGRILEADSALGGFALVATESVDLVLLDFFLGAHDGHDIVELLRGEKPCPNHDVPIIMVTAAPQHPRVRSAMRIGADAVLGKPLTPVELYDTIASVLAAREAADAAGGTVADATTAAAIEFVHRKAG